MSNDNIVSDVVVETNDEVGADIRDEEINMDEKNMILIQVNNNILQDNTNRIVENVIGITKSFSTPERTL